MNPIHYFNRFVYGNVLSYLDTSTPERADVARHVQAMTGSKTLRPQDYSALEGLGFQLLCVPDPKSVRATVFHR